MDGSEKYIAAATKELVDPQFEVTKQYLNVMDVEFENGAPKIARINSEHDRNSVAIYFCIKDERFYIVVNLSKSDQPKVEWVWMESGHRVYLTATSEDLAYEELAGFVQFKPLVGWSKGDMRRNGKSVHKFTRISHEPNPNEAYGLEEKLLELLEHLEQSAEDVRGLAKKSNAYISVCRNQYISANAGIHLNVDILNKLCALNLELDIDTYIVGQEIE